MTTISKDKAMKAGTPAEFAKLIGHEDGGRRVRAKLRSNDIRVSRGDAFDAKAKNLLWEAFVEGKKAAAKTKATKKEKAAK